MKFLEYFIIVGICLMLICLIDYVCKIILLKIEEQKLKIERERETRKRIEKLYEMEIERIKVECREKFKLIEKANKLVEELENAK